MSPLRGFEGHTDGVHSEAFSPDGSKLVTASHDRSARLWDVSTGRELRRLEAHAGVVYDAAFSADGKRVATCGDDALVVVWEADTGEVTAMLKGHTGPVYHNAFLPDGSVVTAGRDGTLRRWNVVEEKCVAQQEAHEAGAYAMAVSRDGTRVATGGGDGVMILWDVGKFQPLWRLAPPPPPDLPQPAEPLRVKRRPPAVIQVAFGHASERADAPAPKVYSLSHHGRVHEWDAVTGDHLRELDATDISMAFALSPDGRRAVIASVNGPHLWELSSMRELAALVPQDYTHGLAFSPDGKLVAMARGGALSATRGWIRAQDPRVPLWDVSKIAPTAETPAAPTAP